jgi:hypothetical protein
MVGTDGCNSFGDDRADGRGVESAPVRLPDAPERLRVGSSDDPFGDGQGMSKRILGDVSVSQTRDRLVKFVGRPKMARLTRGFPRRPDLRQFRPGVRRRSRPPAPVPRLLPRGGNRPAGRRHQASPLGRAALGARFRGERLMERGFDPCLRQLLRSVARSSQPLTGLSLRGPTRRPLGDVDHRSESTIPTPFSLSSRTPPSSSCQAGVRCLEIFRSNGAQPFQPGIF